MSTLRTTNLQHASAASPAIVLASSGSATAQLSSINDGPIAGARNRIINGGFDIWQRGTTSTAVGYQTADRFRYTDNGTGITVTQSQQSFAVGQTDVPGEPSYYYRIAKTGAGTGATYTAIEQGIEDVKVFAGQTATTSFYARCSSGTVAATVYFAQYFGSGGSANVNTATTSCTLTTSWQRFTATVAVPTISGKTIGAGSALFWTLQLPNNSTFTIDLALVQAEPGSVATPFERRSYGQELALCQRYYYITDGAAESIAYGTDRIYGGSLLFPVAMRATPTYTAISNTASTGNAGTIAFIGNTRHGRLYNSANNWTSGAILGINSTFSAEL